MFIRPELQALRGDDAPQRQAQAALREVYEAWRRQGAGHRLEAELARLGRGGELEDLPLLSALFDPADDSAAALIGDLLAMFLARLNAEPLSQVPLRYATDEVVSSLVLARQGDSLLVLQAIDGAGLARRAQPTTASFPPAETWERVLVGQAYATRVCITALRPDGAELAQSDTELVPGMVAHRLGSREAQLIHGVSGSLVVLRLQRRTQAGAVTREHRLDDGHLVHQSAGTPRDSRLELTTALLGRMGRADAAPLLAAMAEEDGSPSLRWQSLRECLGLDTAIGFAALGRIAACANDPLAVSAGALRAQLLEAHPQLAGVCQCPA